MAAQSGSQLKRYFRPEPSRQKKAHYGSIVPWLGVTSLHNYNAQTGRLSEPRNGMVTSELAFVPGRRRNYRGYS